MKNEIKLTALSAVVLLIAFAACSDGGTPAHVHQYGAWTVTRAATCTAEGEETGTCPDDGATTTRAIAVNPTAHNWGEWNATTEPTCTEKGRGSRTCTLNQSHTETDKEIDALGHDYEWTETQAATCSEKGTESGVCKHDDSHTTTRDIAIDPTAHDWEQLTGTAPTCTETGSGKRKCTICETEETLAVIPALGHDYGAWTETTAATCTTAGINTRTCSHDATHKETQPIAALGHNYQYTVTTPAACTTAGVETGTCTHDSSHTTTRPITALGHNYQYTVTTPAACTTAGEEKGTCTHDSSHTTTRAGAAALGHDFGNWTVTSEGVETRTCAHNAAHTETRLNIAMVSIPGGSFQMGDTKNEGYDGEKPVHTVTLNSFYMGKYQVTQAQYQAVMGSNPSLFSSNPASGEVQANRPVETVRWYDAIVFCNKLSMAEGLTPAYSISGSADPADWGTVPTSSNSTWNAAVIVSGSNGYRLPTEAQWEYAAKGGDGSPGNYTYSGSNTIGDVAWYSINSSSTHHEVGKKLPNGLGLYDMSGNVSEWCWDWYGNYSSGAQTDPVGAVSGSYRVLRGGSWYDSAVNVRSALRNVDNPSSGDYDVGFRLVRPVQ